MPRACHSVCPANIGVGRGYPAGAAWPNVHACSDTSHHAGACDVTCCARGDFLWLLLKGIAAITVSVCVCVCVRACCVCVQCLRSHKFLSWLRMYRTSSCECGRRRGDGRHKPRIKPGAATLQRVPQTTTWGSPKSKSMFYYVGSNS